MRVRKGNVPHCCIIATECRAVRMVQDSNGVWVCPKCKTSLIQDVKLVNKKTLLKQGV